MTEMTHSERVFALMSPIVDALLDCHRSGVDANVVLDAALSIFISVVVSFEAEEQVTKSLPKILRMIEAKRAERVVAHSLSTGSMQ